MYIELNLPEQQIGEWSLQSFIMEDGKKYQKLLKGDFLIMDNTPDIVEGYKDFLHRAKGNVLINGFGIGACCQYLLNKPSITKLTIIEVSQQIVDMVAPHFMHDPRCTIIRDDAFKYQPRVSEIFDYIWHDIWFYYKASNLKQMEVLFDKYKDMAKWQGAWKQKECLELQKKEQSVIFS